VSDPRDRILNRPTRIGDAGRKAEKKTAKRTGLRLTPASGAMSGAKGDMSGRDCLVENKSTTTMTMSLTFEMLSKIATEALASGRVPVLSFQFTTESGEPRRAGAWVAIPEALARELGVLDV
jgi:hypothetical protein